MRGFLEADFAGGSDRLHLRHAFGQWQGWLLGQTWSTFSDPEAEPDGIDFEGLNAISLFRQPQIRWTRPIATRQQLSVALEEASPDLTGATGVNQVPDLVVRWRWDPQTSPGRAGLLGQGSHIQAALLLRQLRGELGQPGEDAIRTLATEGYGVNVSGVVLVPWARASDRIRFAWNAGRGIGRYISDLSSLGGQDAVYDPRSAELEPLEVAAAYLGYEHWWRETLRSTLTAGFVWVDNLDFQKRPLTRRDFLKLSALSLGGLAVRPWGRKLFQLPEFPQADRLGPGGLVFRRREGAPRPKATPLAYSTKTASYPG